MNQRLNNVRFYDRYIDRNSETGIQLTLVL